MGTAFVARPLEFGPDNTPDTSPDSHFDIFTENFSQLAAILEA